MVGPLNTRSGRTTAAEGANGADRILRPGQRKVERATLSRRARQRRARRNWILATIGVVAICAAVFASARNGAEQRRKLEAFLTAGSCRLDALSDKGRSHVDAATYTVEPPSGGNHSPFPASAGDYTGGRQAPPDDQVIHALEHGFVAIWTGSIQASPELKNLRREFTDDLLLISRPSLGNGVVVATAWHSRLSCTEVEPEVLARFIETRANKGPERVPHPPSV
ncbi:MAG: DUF3105 domain-containing protein [Acidimicrobiales bacterium]